MGHFAVVYKENMTLSSNLNDGSQLQLCMPWKRHLISPRPQFRVIKLLYS
jgi:hypothetical protein